MEAELKNVRCIVTCDNMAIMRGDACFVPLARARMMESQGSLKIIDKLEPKQKTVCDFDFLYRFHFSQRRTTRVAWVQNYSKNGGAEISNFTAVRIGQNLGFDISGVVIDAEQFSFKILDDSDIIIVNNLHNGRRKEILDYLYATKKPWIKYDHDRCETEFDLYKRSRLNVFISPAHQAHYAEKCGQEILSKSICLPLAFDVDAWQNKIDGRIPGSIFIPVYMKCRNGVQEFMRTNPHYKYFMTGSVKPIYGADITILNEINYQDMPEVYRRYETVLHIPNNKTAGERILFEAVLSGCKVITNDNAGHTSWSFDWRDERVLRPILRRAVYQFWHEVENVIDGK